MDGVQEPFLGAMLPYSPNVTMYPWRPYPEDPIDDSAGLCKWLSSRSMYPRFVPIGQMLLVYVMAKATAAILRVRGEFVRVKPTGWK